MIFRSRSPRSQTPSPQVLYDQDKKKAQEIEARYEVAIAFWSMNQGCVADDYTDDQFERFHALRTAHGDSKIASRLLFGQWLFDLGHLDEWGWQS